MTIEELSFICEEKLGFHKIETLSFIAFTKEGVQVYYGKKECIEKITTSGLLNIDIPGDVFVSIQYSFFELTEELLEKSIKFVKTSSKLLEDKNYNEQ